MIAASTPISNNGNNLRVALIDDQPLFRMGLQMMLSRAPEIDLVAEAADDGETTCVAAGTEFEVAVVGNRSPSANASRDMVQRLHSLRPTCKILALAPSPDPLRAAELLRAGATGCALKSQSSDDIIGAIRSVGGGERYLAPQISSAEVDALLAGSTWRMDLLTPREHEIFDLLVRGTSNDEVANRLFIAYRTVETHRRHIMQKLGVRSIVDLVRIAARHGLLD